MKFLLCRPRGGFNDTLNQIEWCFRYAERFNRTLIIDTEYLVATGIGVNFSKIFRLTHPNTPIFLQLTAELTHHLNKLSTYPHACYGRLDQYQTRLNEQCKFIDTTSGSALTFNFNKDYSENVLIHDQLGGGELGIHCLRRLQLTESFRHDVLSLLQPLLGNTHLGIHIRNTDFITDYKSFFKSIYEKTIDHRVLVCSDTYEVIEFAKNYLSQSEVIHLSHPPHSGEFSLPTYATYACNEKQRYELMVCLFADLIGLGMSSSLMLSELKLGTFSQPSANHKDFAPFAKIILDNPTLKIGINGISGFGYLAQSLKSAPTVITQLFAQ